MTKLVFVSCIDYLLPSVVLPFLMSLRIRTQLSRFLSTLYRILFLFQGETFYPIILIYRSLGSLSLVAVIPQWVWRLGTTTLYACSQDF